MMNISTAEVSVSLMSMCDFPVPAQRRGEQIAREFFPDIALTQQIGNLRCECLKSDIRAKIPMRLQNLRINEKISPCKYSLHPIDLLSVTLYGV